MPRKNSADTQREAGLDERIRAARSRLDSDGGGDSRFAFGPGIAFAFRVGTELVAALVVGVGIGYGLDWWLGTGPWLLVLFFFLGAAAGVTNVWRAASGKGAAVGYADFTSVEKDAKSDRTD